MRSISGKRLRRRFDGQNRHPSAHLRYRWDDGQQSGSDLAISGAIPNCSRRGRAVARLSIATNEEGTKDGDRVVVWGPRAERIAAQLRKGTLVYVEGRLRTRTATNGETRQQTRTEIHAQQLMSLGSRTRREAAYGASETNEFRNGDEVPF